MSRWTCVFAVVVAMALSANAMASTLLVYEGFDYNTGALRGNDGPGAPDHGSIGWGGVWTRQDNATTSSAGTVASGSLSYSTLPTSGNHLSVPNTSGNTNRDYRYLGTRIVGTEYPEIWISFLAQTTSDGSGHAGIGLFDQDTSTHTTGPEMTTIGKGSGLTWGYGTGLSSSGNLSQSTVNPTELALLVYRFVTDPITGRATSHLWVNPGLDAEPATADADAHWIQTSGTFAFNRLRVSHALGSGHTLTLDEIRIGTTYESVVMEQEVVAVVPLPAAVWGGLVLMGVIGGVRRRRRMA